MLTLAHFPAENASLEYETHADLGDVVNLCHSIVILITECCICCPGHNLWGNKIWPRHEVYIIFVLLSISHKRLDLRNHDSRPPLTSDQ